MKRHNDQIIGDILKEWANRKRFKSKINQVKIKEMWAELMGASVAKHTLDIALRQNKLFIELDSSPLRQELSYGKEKIIKILNEAIGEALIEKVIIR
ncbi:MAG: DUF721 domain-containing protein [Saprospiraceae bacterium]